MKLYTEEQVREAMFELHPYADGIDKIIDLLTPIELPSDEEIGEATRTKALYDCSYETNFRLGAKWMKEQILNK